MSKQKKQKVLFVDGEVNVLNAIRRAVQEEEYESLFAKSGKEALDLLAAGDIAVLVTDMRMPEIDGLEFLKQVEEISPDTIKIIQSGQSDMYQLINVINSIDVFNFILKPWSVEDSLKPVINKAISQYELIRANKEMQIQLEKQFRELEIKHFRLQKVTEVDQVVDLDDAVHFFLPRA